MISYAAGDNEDTGLMIEKTYQDALIPLQGELLNTKIFEPIITLVLPSCSTVNSTIGTTDRPTWIKTSSHGSRVQASPKHQQSPSLYCYDLLTMVCRWHTHVVGCHLHTLQAKLYSSMF